MLLRTVPAAAPSGGGRHHLLLSDFGVAKALESTKAMACTQCGTPYYLPPEVCNGAAYDIKADMWSLGVLSYEIASLRYPFTGGHAYAHSAPQPPHQPRAACRITNAASRTDALLPCPPPQARRSLNSS